MRARRQTHHYYDIRPFFLQNTRAPRLFRAGPTLKGGPTSECRFVLPRPCLRVPAARPPCAARPRIASVATLRPTACLSGVCQGPNWMQATSVAKSGSWERSASGRDGTLAQYLGAQLQLTLISTSSWTFMPFTVATTEDPLRSLLSCLERIFSLDFCVLHCVDNSAAVS